MRLEPTLNGRMGKDASVQLWIGWTTLESERAACDLAAKAVETGLAACAQVEGPVSSYYNWKGETCVESEWRVVFKFLSSQTHALEAWLQEEHPYETHQWVCWPAARVADAYLRWAQEDLSD